MKEEGRTIGELVQPRSEKAIPREFPHLPYVGLEHVEAHTTRLLGSAPAKDMRSAAKRFYYGDVLYSRLRPYLNKVWRADRDGLCSSEFIVMPENGAVDANFLRYRLNSADFVSFANSLNAGDRPRVDFDQISSFILPPFSLSQQRAAVAEIDKHFTRLDVGVAALRRVQANLKRYRAAVLKAACEGRLVPTEAELAKAEGGTCETGEQLLARILADRRKHWHGRGKYKEPVAPDTTNLPPLPEGWTWASPDQLSSAAAYALAIGPFGSNLKVSDYTDAGVPLVFVRNIRSARFGGEHTVFVSANKANELRAHHVSAGEILVTKMGEPPGEACLYPDSAPDAVITADCIKLRLAPILLQKHFFVHAINSEVVKPQIQLITKGVAQMKISLGRFSSLAIPMPPLAEQVRIVAEVERRLSVIVELEAAVAANLQRAVRLRQSILRKTFCV